MNTCIHQPTIIHENMDKNTPKTGKNTGENTDENACEKTWENSQLFPLNSISTDSGISANSLSLGSGFNSSSCTSESDDLVFCERLQYDNESEESKHLPKLVKTRIQLGSGNTRGTCTAMEKEQSGVSRKDKRLQRSTSLLSSSSNVTNSTLSRSSSSVSGIKRVDNLPLLVRTDRLKGYDIRQSHTPTKYDVESVESTCVKNKKTLVDHVGEGSSSEQRTPSGNKGDNHDLTAGEAEDSILPIKISKLEDCQTVKERIKPGMVTDVRRIFARREWRMKRTRPLSKGHDLRNTFGNLNSDQELNPSSETNDNKPQFEIPSELNIEFVTPEKTSTPCAPNETIETVAPIYKTVLHVQCSLGQAQPDRNFPGNGKGSATNVGPHVRTIQTKSSREDFLNTESSSIDMNYKRDLHSNKCDDKEISDQNAPSPECLNDRNYTLSDQDTCTNNLFKMSPKISNSNVIVPPLKLDLHSDSEDAKLTGYNDLEPDFSNDNSEFDSESEEEDYLPYSILSSSSDEDPDVDIDVSPQQNDIILEFKSLTTEPESTSGSMPNYLDNIIDKQPPKHKINDYDDDILDEGNLNMFNFTLPHNRKREKTVSTEVTDPYRFSVSERDLNKSSIKPSCKIQKHVEKRPSGLHNDEVTGSVVYTPKENTPCERNSRKEFSTEKGGSFNKKDTFATPTQKFIYIKNASGKYTRGRLIPVLTDAKTRNQRGLCVSRVHFTPVRNSCPNTSLGHKTAQLPGPGNTQRTTDEAAVPYLSPGLSNTLNIYHVRTNEKANETNNISSQSKTTCKTDAIPLGKEEMSFSVHDFSGFPEDRRLPDNSDVFLYSPDTDSFSEYNFDQQSILTMPERSSGNTSFSSSDDSRTMTKYSASTEFNSENNMSESERDAAKQQLKILAEAMSKLTASGECHAQNMPRIQQSVTNLDGGNLIVTTLTRKILEEEDNNNGPPSPTEVPTNVFIVQDHLGRMYYIEDVTEDSQESVYCGTSAYPGVSQDNYYNTIHNLQSVGQSGIDYSTAEELLMGLYSGGNSGGLHIEEVDESSTHQKQISKRSTCNETATPVRDQLNYYAENSVNREESIYGYDQPRYQAPPVQTIRKAPQSASTVKTIKQSYEMTSSSPYGRPPTGADGSFQFCEGDDNIKTHREESVATTTIDHTGCNSTFSTYKYQTDAKLEQEAVPQPIPPPILPLVPLLPPVPPPQPCRLVQLDLTPSQVVSSTPIMSAKVAESSDVKKEVETKVTTLSEPGRPVYKSVALVKGSYDTPKWHEAKRREEDELDSKKYKIISTKATDEVKRSQTTVEENSTSVYRVSRSEAGNVRGLNRSHGEAEEGHIYRTEKVFHVNGGVPEIPKSHTSKISIVDDAAVRGARRGEDQVDSRYPLDTTEYEEYTENIRDITTQKMEVQGVPNYERIEPYDSGADRDMRVVRGNILIKNTLEQGLDEFSDNINLFHKGFNLSKDNPLYKSDEDLSKYSKREEEWKKQRDLLDERKRQRDRVNEIGDELTFETVDRYQKKREVKKDHPRTQNFSKLILSRLSNFDAKDIRQNIDVKHKNEEVYGDPRLAEGVRGDSKSGNFDSVKEDIDLVMKYGKAFITITATAERYTPIDLEFNVWRKSQAIVTRVIEIDFQANEQRRMLYEQVMQKASGDSSDLGGQGHANSRGHSEKVLSTQETLDVFSELMGATGGQGDLEDITVKTSQRKTAMLPQDFLY